MKTPINIVYYEYIAQIMIKQRKKTPVSPEQDVYAGRSGKREIPRETKYENVRKTNQTETKRNIRNKPNRPTTAFNKSRCIRRHGVTKTTGECFFSRARTSQDLEQIIESISASTIHVTPVMLLKREGVVYDLVFDENACIPIRQRPAVSSLIMSHNEWYILPSQSDLYIND